MSILMKNPRNLEQGSVVLIVVLFILGFIVSQLIGWVVFPKLLYSKHKQPIDFNHSLHLQQVSNSCESCHFFREDGSFAGSPKLAQCVDCHQQVVGKSPEEAIFVQSYVEKNKEVPWFNYSKQPACVFFSHAAHVKKGKMDCKICHGAIGESTNLKIYEENRLSGYSRDIWGQNIAGFPKKNTWDSMKMDDCAKCHEEKRHKNMSVQTKKDGCFLCHK